MNSFARLLYSFVAASLPAAFGLLVTGILMMSAINDIQARNVADPNEIRVKKEAAFAPAHLGLEVSIPLWVVWAVYLLMQGNKPKE